jgi:hypothetical protein
MSAEQEASVARQAGVAGLVAVFLLIASLPMAWPWPDVDAPAGAIAVYFQESRAGVLWQAWTATAGVVLLIPLAVGIAELMRARGRAVASATLRGAMLLLAGTFASSWLPWIAIALRPGPPEVMVALYDLGLLGRFVGAGLPLALGLGALALGTLDGAVLPRWIAVLALGEVPIAVVLAGCTASRGLFAPSGPVGFASMALFTVLGVASSIALLGRGRAVPAEPASLDGAAAP